MPITYEMFMKHAEKVTNNAPEVRPILSGVKHLENGDLAVTDSHRLYVAKNIHSREDGAVLTPKGKTVDGNYPDVSRLIPDSAYAKQSIQFDVQELLLVADMIASIGALAEKEAMSDKAPGMDFKDGVISYYNYQCKIKYSVTPVQFEVPILANAFYLLDAMKLFKAIGCQTVTMNFFGSSRPFTFSNEGEDLLILILPIRKY